MRTCAQEPCIVNAAATIDQNDSPKAGDDSSKNPMLAPYEEIHNNM